MGAAQRGRVDVVLVWKLDRFGRSALDLLANVRALGAAGVGFVAITQGIELRPGGDAMSSLMLTILAGVAEFERELVRERTRLGLAKARRAGRALGRPRALERDDEARAGQLRASGLTWPQVAAQLGCSVASARRAAQRDQSQS